MSSNTGENRKQVPFFFSTQKKEVELKDDEIEHNNCQFLEECKERVTKFYFISMCINPEGRVACRAFAKKIEKLTDKPALMIPSHWLSTLANQEDEIQQIDINEGREV